MKHTVIRSMVALALLAALGGCEVFDIFTLDTHKPPNATISGRVIHDGKPVGVRSNGVQLELWQPSPEFELNQKIPVHVAQEGTFSATVFDGDYEINLLAGNGPWVSNTTRIPVSVRGSATLDISVVPYYTIQDESITFNPAGGGPNGTIQATFRVGQVNTSRQLEFVGLYIGPRWLVDRNLSYPIPNAQRERTRAAIQTQLNSNAPITINVQLPANVYETGSPARREEVYVRVGVKTVGVAELLFTEVHRIAI